MDKVSQKKHGLHHASLGRHLGTSCRQIEREGGRQAWKRGRGAGKVLQEKKDRKNKRKQRKKERARARERESQRACLLGRSSGSSRLSMSLQPRHFRCCDCSQPPQCSGSECGIWPAGLQEAALMHGPRLTALWQTGLAAEPHIAMIHVPRLRSAVLRCANVPWYKKFNWYSFALYRYKAPELHWESHQTDGPLG